MSQDTRATPGIRLSPAARALLLDLKKVSGTEDSALLEQAVTHYYAQLLGKSALRDRLKNLLESTPPPSEESREVLSWLSSAFASEPVPLEGKTPQTPLFEPTLEHISLPSLGELSSSSDSLSILTDAQGWALPEKPQLEPRRKALNLTLSELAHQSSLSEETLGGLENGALLWLSLQEQWALASALDWSLEQLQEALEKSLL